MDNYLAAGTFFMCQHNRRSPRLVVLTLSLSVLFAFPMQPSSGQSLDSSAVNISPTIAEISTKASQALQAKDYASAMTYYRMAADRGDAQAQYEIGLLYSKGAGVSRVMIKRHFNGFR
jgi:hypothetical protein